MIRQGRISGNPPHTWAIGDTRQEDHQARRAEEREMRQGRREGTTQVRSDPRCIVMVDAGACGMTLGGVVSVWGLLAR